MSNVWKEKENDPSRHSVAVRVEQLKATNDAQQLLPVVTDLRKLLSIERNPPLQHVIDAGAVPYLVRCLQYDVVPLQFEAAWALSTIAAGSSDQARTVIEANAVPYLVHGLAKSPSDDLREQAVWVLGNLAAHSPPLRDYVLQQGALNVLLQNLVGQSRLSLLRNATWALSNLCRGEPAPRFDVMQPAFPVLARLIHLQDEEILADACWALANLSDGGQTQIQAILEAGAIRRCVELLVHGSHSVKVPALRVVGNILSGNDQQKQEVLNCSVLPVLHTLLRHPKKAMRKEACSAISNITAGNRDHIQATQALWVMLNAIKGGTPEQVAYFITLGCIRSLCGLLSLGVAPCALPEENLKAVTLVLAAMEAILLMGASMTPAGDINQCASRVQEDGGVAKLERLQECVNHEVASKANSILSTFYNRGADPFTFGSLRASLP